MYKVQPKKVSLGSNELLVTPMTRRRANAFRSDMAAAGDDMERQEAVGVAAIAEHVTFADGPCLDVDDVPQSDLVTLLEIVVGGGRRGVADFTDTP